MAVVEYSPSSGEDTRSIQERGQGLRDTLLTAGGIAIALAARKKVAITRGISRDIVSAGLHSERRLERFISSSARSATSPGRTTAREAAAAKMLGTAKNIGDWVADLSRPFPKGQDLLRIAYQQGHGSIGTVNFGDLRIPERSFFETILRGPQIVSFSPGTTTGLARYPKVGEFGGMLINSNLYEFANPALNVSGQYVSRVIPGFHTSLTSLWGAHAERSKRGLIRFHNIPDAETFVRKVDLDSRSVLAAEEKLLVDRYLGKFFGLGSSSQGKTVEEMREMADVAWATRYGIRTERDILGNLRISEPAERNWEHVPSYKQFLGEKVETHFPGETVSPRTGRPRPNITVRRKLAEDAWLTRRLIAREAAKTKFAQARFEAYKFSEKIGIGEQFTKYGGGAPQQAERWLREGAGWDYHYLHVDPKGIVKQGDLLPQAKRRYNIKDIQLGSKVRGGEGPWYLTTAEDSAKRWANILSFGTFHRVGEKAFGIGVTNRPNEITELIRRSIGASEGSWADYWIRGQGQTARALGIGLTAFYGYKFANYLSRQVMGSGPTDLAADAYVHARELQQNLLNITGVTGLAKTMENAFPGSVTSPAAHAIRLLAPLAVTELMSHILKRRLGPKEYLLGLAAGLSFALITWGDITQSPEELHRIFTGEQDIPVRKGRYWLLGKTPFFGGKIAYWRPHWYSMMKSGYQNQGQLWDSETEYWAQGSPLSPILAPVLTGRLWDPYYWEKKHYEDRPYPISGELFEPTMPFAWMGNLTVGRLIKPPRLMHQEYLGNEQTNISQWDRGLPPGTSAELGLSDLSGVGISQSDSPYSMKYQLGMAAYAQTEQMGLTGFLANTLWSKFTGQNDFMTSQSVLQSPRRATGYERGYWEKELGDPGAGLDEGITEYFRRYLPHRRSNVDEYNPIPNQMPDWLPGEDYFINFRQGDPFIKVPYGEARLPGKGYEALHELHSNIPGVYDAVDRLMILANVAPYSDEYKHYKVLAKGMTKGDEKWARKVEQSIAQREAINQEYQFLDYNTENVPHGLKTASSVYKHILGAATNFPNPLSLFPMKVLAGGIPTNITKWLPYKTPESAYEDYRLYGSEFSMWDQPGAGFILPLLRKARSMVDRNYIPESVQERRDIQEYFDKLKYIKYQNLAQIARYQGDMKLASKLSRITRTTMTAGNYHPAAAMMSVPKEEKSFYREFSDAKGRERDRILAITPSYMHNYYKRAWNEADGQKTYDIDYQTSSDLVAYFKDHYLPPANWRGWHPDVGLEQVKLRVVKNEAFDIHKFNLWESNERQLARQPFTPSIDNINAPSNDLTMLQNIIMSNMEHFGMKNNRVFISRTPADENTHRIRIKIDKDTSQEDDEKDKAELMALMG